MQRLWRRQVLSRKWGDGRELMFGVHGKLGRAGGE